MLTSKQILEIVENWAVVHASQRYKTLSTLILRNNDVEAVITRSTLPNSVHLYDISLGIINNIIYRRDTDFAEFYRTEKIPEEIYYQFSYLYQEAFDKKINELISKAYTKDIY